MSYIDLQATLREWPYEPEKISVRKVLGADGTIKLQMRVEMGILQLEADGRPDGARPQGYESALAYSEALLAQEELRSTRALKFTLNPEACHDLRAEASLYYRRYIAFFVLEEYANVFRDTAHSLAVFDLCAEYAAEEEDRVALEEFRPYVLMMDARARAYHALAEGEPASALAHANRGILYIKSHFEKCEDPQREAGSEEVKILRALCTELGGKIPKDSLMVARKALQVAIEEERFEEAARLRDELENLRDSSGKPPKS